MEVYGAGKVEYSADAEKAIDKFSSLGYDRLPICMAKTQYSLSHDPAVKGAPKGFVFPVADVRLSRRSRLRVSPSRAISIPCRACPQTGLHWHGHRSRYRDDYGLVVSRA